VNSRVVDKQFGVWFGIAWQDVGGAPTNKLCINEDAESDEMWRGEGFVQAGLECARGVFGFKHQVKYVNQVVKRRPVSWSELADVGVRDIV
jgi:hypothetical protein